MNSLPISAVICTHNREDYLGAAIDSLLEQDFSNYEVIVVDNASSDSTKQIVESRLPHPRLQYVYEPVTGLSVARNTGAKASQGEIIAYLDDDAVASTGWLRCLWQAYQNNPQLAIAGGKVTLIFPPGKTSPPWLSADLASNLGAYDLGDEIVYITNPGMTPRGLNYSLRRTFLEQIGGFDVNLGRVGKNLLSNEELQMTQLALEKQWQVAYLPQALVAHNVAPERLQPAWFLRRSWWQGVSECYRERLANQDGIGQIGRGGERFLRGIYKAAKYFRKPDGRFSNLVYAYGQIGYLKSVIGGIFSPANLS